MSRVWSEEDIRSLGVRTDAETAGSIFGLGRTQTYHAIKTGTFPIPVIHVGRRIIVPTAPLRRLLGIDPNPNSTEGAPVPSAPSIGNDDSEEEIRHDRLYQVRAVK